MADRLSPRPAHTRQPGQPPLADTAVIRTMRLVDVLDRWRPGSHEWTWDDEDADLYSTDPIDRPDGDGTWPRREYQQALEARIRQEGIGFADHVEPIQLGNDGRVWNGHHRLVAARRLGVELVTVDVQFLPEEDTDA